MFIYLKEQIFSSFHSGVSEFFLMQFKSNTSIFFTLADDMFFYSKRPMNHNKSVYC